MLGVMAQEGSMKRIDIEYFLEYVLVSNTIFPSLLALIMCLPNLSYGADTLDEPFSRSK
jgi:hypothetical protein